MTVHSPAWFAKQEARLQEPIKNTVRYLGKSAIIKIFAGLPTLILPVIGIIELYKLRKFLESYSTLTTAIMNNGRAVTNDGPPGTGKTFTGSNVAYMLAIEQWHKLKSDYNTQRTMVAQWVKTGETDKLEAFQALEQSYNFFKEHEAENIPCLVSSVPLREYGTGRMSFKLTPELFRQIERVPEYTVIFNDESGLDQGAETSKTDDKDLLAFWRFCRHFFDGMFINTNQVVDGVQRGVVGGKMMGYDALHGLRLMKPDDVAVLHPDRDGQLRRMGARAGDHGVHIEDSGTVWDIVRVADRLGAGNLYLRVCPGDLACDALYQLQERVGGKSLRARQIDVQQDGVAADLVQRGAAFPHPVRGGEGSVRPGDAQLVVHSLVAVDHLGAVVVIDPGAQAIPEYRQQNQNQHRQQDPGAPERPPRDISGRMGLFPLVDAFGAIWAKRRFLM